MNSDDEMFHIKKAPIDAYEGKDDYVFVTYSHKDAELVFPNLKMFDLMGINIFYDEGLPSGSSWFETLENKIKHSSLLIPFMSQNTVDSKPSRKEIFLAFRSDIPILPIYLKPTTLEKGLDLAIGDEQSIYQYSMSAEKYLEMCIREFKRHGVLKEKITTPEPHKRRGRFFGMHMPAPQNPQTILNSTPLIILPDDYIYVSYPHENIDLVVPDLEQFQKDGFAIKTDKGIDFNDRWKYNIYKLIKNSSLFVFYITNDSVQLERTLMELKMAQELNKDICAISLEKTDVELPISEDKIIKKYQMDEIEFKNTYAKLFEMKSEKIF